MSIDVVAITTLLHALNEGTYSQIQLQEMTGMCNQSIGRWLRAVKKKKLIFIAEWHKHGKVWVAYYQWGFEEPDAPKPKPLTNKEHCSNYAERVRKNLLHSNSVRLSERKQI